MIVIGISWVLFWALIQAFSLSVDKAAIVTGVAFILLGLVFEGVPNFRKP